MWRWPWLLGTLVRRGRAVGTAAESAAAQTALGRGRRCRQAWTDLNTRQSVGNEQRVPGASARHGVHGALRSRQPTTPRAARRTCTDPAIAHRDPRPGSSLSGQTSMATAASGGPRAVFKPAGGRNKAAAPDPTKQARARAAVVPGGRSVARRRRCRREVASNPAASTAVSPLQQDRHTTLSGLLLRAEAAPDPLERMLAVCRCCRHCNMLGAVGVRLGTPVVD